MQNKTDLQELLLKVTKSELKKCICFGGTRGNKVIVQKRTLYPFREIIDLKDYDNLYFEPKYSSSSILIGIHVWEDYKFIGNDISDYVNILNLSIAKFKEALNNYKYFTFEGFKEKLNFKKDKGLFISLLDIELLKLAKNNELAEKYSTYRLEFINKNWRKKI